MRLEASRHFYTFWQGLGGIRATRNSFDPGRVGAIARDLWLIAVAEASPPRFRVAGSRLCRLFGAELSGAPVHQVVLAPDRAALDVAIVAAATERVPMIAGFLVFRGETVAGHAEGLLLPMIGDRPGERLLIGGLFVHDRAPFQREPRRLSLVSHRRLGALVPSVRLGEPHPDWRERVRVRAKLMVIDGDRDRPAL